MLRLFKNKVFLLILVTLLIFVFMGITASQDSKANWISNIVSVPLTPVQRFSSFAGQKIDAGLSFFKNIQTTKQENENLKIRINELEKENRELIGFRDKIGSLREALNLKDKFDDYDIIGGNVIAKDAGNWFNVFKIDIGQKDGIQSDFPVVTATKGLVGRVMVSDATSSKVISIIDQDSVVSGWITKSGGHVIVRGDLSLKDKGLCRADYIPPDVDVEVGDVIETLGLGEVYPKGIVIGKVLEIRKTNSELNRYAIIQPVVDFKRLEEVFVLKNRNNINGNGSIKK